MVMDLFAVIVWCANKVVNNSHLIDKSGGVLSVDTAGPFVRAYDAGGYKTAYILVGALTWTVPKGSPLKEDDVEELEEEAPNFDAKKGEEQDQLQIEDEPAGHEPVQGIFDDPEDENEEPEVQKAPEGEVEEKEEKAEEEKKVRRKKACRI